MGARSPLHYQGVSGSVFLYVPDVDTVFKRATDAGAQALMPPTDMFWGDRFGKIRDPFGHEWGLATHQWDLTPEEMQIAAEAAMKKPPAS
jgi:PhnB protein